MRKLTKLLRKKIKMKVEYPVTINGKVVKVTTECDKQSDVFKFIANMEEVFGDLVCRKGDKTSEQVKLQVRTDDDENEYYEAVCTELGDLQWCSKKFGQKKKGDMNLFPKNKDEDGKWNPWRKYNKETGKEE